MSTKQPQIEPEHPDEKGKICPNCTSPLVIRDDIWNATLYDHRDWTGYASHALLRKK